MLKIGKGYKPNKKEVVGSKPLSLPIAGKFQYEVPSIKKRKKYGKNSQARK